MVRQDNNSSQTSFQHNSGAEAHRRALAELELPPFRLMRWGVALLVGVCVAFVLVSRPAPAEGLLGQAAIATLLVAGIGLEIALFWSERRLERNRGRVEKLWEQQRAELIDVATRDELTQLQNRRFYYERLTTELDRAQQRKQPLSLLMIDVDDLKAINDEFGHQVGDAVLRRFARLLNEFTDERHITARLGGDEFAVVMPDADRRDAEHLAVRLWQKLADAPVYETDHASIYLGVSIGSSGYPWSGNDVDEITRWADTKLYANKLERKRTNLGRGTPNEERLAAAVTDVLSVALDVRDRMTHRHARRVARTASAVARAMQLPHEKMYEIEYAAALHDIGKIGVPDSILRKSSPLDPEEWKQMRRHCELGYEILKGIDFFRNAADIVYAHHEHYDGRGYPRGLVREEIPLGARLFAVVDAYDAMTSRRPYRDAMPRALALREIEKNAGTQFDPAVIDAFLRVIQHSPEGFYEEQQDNSGSQTPSAGITVIAANQSSPGRLLVRA